MSRRPVLESIILIFAVYGVLYVVLYYFTLHPIETYSTDVIYAVLRLMIAPILLIIYSRDFSFRIEKLGFAIAMPSLLFAFYNVATGLESGFSVDEMEEVSYVLLYGMAPAVLEEILFRGIVLQMLLGRPSDSQERKESEMFAVSVSALLFALTHGAAYLINGAAGEDIFTAIMQMLFTLVLGVNFGIAYVKTKDIVSVILIHGIIDVSAYLFNGSVFTDVAKDMFLVYIALSLTLTAVYAFWFSRRKAA